MISYVKDESYNNGALDLCNRRNFNLINFSGGIFYCSSFNMASMFNNANNFSNKIFFSYYQKNIDNLEILSQRLQTIFLNHPDKRINDYFSENFNMNHFKNFLSKINFDYDEIINFETNVPQSSIIMLVIF